MLEHDKKVDELRQQIAQVPRLRDRTDLYRMLGAAQTLMTDLSKESVNCRRQHKTTEHYLEIHARIEKTLLNVEKYLFWAKLLR